MGAAVAEPADGLDLSSAQALFASLVGMLLRFVDGQAHIRVTLGEAWRSPATSALYAKAGLGITNSLHGERLAIDLNVFVDGEYSNFIGDYAVLGEYWKTLHPLARWGGDFAKADPDHFSLSWQGRS